MELVMKSMADATAALHHATAEVASAEVAQCVAVAAMCDLYQVDQSVLFEGAERLIAGGGDGTPMIGEFVIAEVAGALKASIGSALEFTATVLNLRHRHPRLWRAAMTGSVRVWQARLVSEACEAAGLSREACLAVDRHCAIALAQQPWARVRRQLDGWILLADPARAAEREAAAAERRHVSFGEFRDGHVPLWAQLDAADGLALDEAITGIADTLPDADQHARRAAALGVMARHALGQEPLPLPGHDPACAPRVPRRPVEIVVQFAAPRPCDASDASRARPDRSRWSTAGDTSSSNASPTPSPGAASPSVPSSTQAASGPSTATGCPTPCASPSSTGSPSTPSPTARAAPARATPITPSPRNAATTPTRGKPGCRTWHRYRGSPTGSRPTAAGGSNNPSPAS